MARSARPEEDRQAGDAVENDAIKRAGEVAADLVGARDDLSSDLADELVAGVGGEDVELFAELPLDLTAQDCPRL